MSHSSPAGAAARGAAGLDPLWSSGGRTLASPRAWASAILVCGCALSVALNWPGQLSWDSVVQLADGRSGHYNAWHPPVMAWMLGAGDFLLRGTGLFILFDTLLFFASFASILWLARRPSRAVASVALLCAALPQVLLYQGIVWKDVLFADAAVAGFVLLAHAASRWKRPEWRNGLLIASFALLALAALTRQNGILALPFGGLALAILARKSGWARGKATAWAMGATAGAVALTLAASAALATRTVGAPQPQGQFRLLQFYDLIGEKRGDPALRLTKLSRVDPSLVSAIRHDGVRLYTPVRNDTLFSSGRLEHALVAARPDAISTQWREVLAKHPRDYLRTRLDVFRWMVSPPDPGLCMPYYTGVTGPPGVLHALGLTPRFRTQDRVLGAYAGMFVGTPVLSHLTFAALALALLFLFLRRRRLADVPFACLLASALAYTASFFVISIACDYRYLLVLDFAAIASLFYWTTSIGGEQSSRFTAEQFLLKRLPPRRPL